MRSSPPKNNHTRPSLRTPGGARSVLLRMAADQERADRIRALKQARPDLTWRRIADHVGVTERSATDWQTKGGIDYANAVKLAELFEVDVDYVWRGPVEADRAPSPFAGQDALADRLDGIERSLARIEQALGIDQTASPSTEPEHPSTRQILVGLAESIRALEDAPRRQAEAPEQ
jgi:hypothetical protein